MHSTPIIIFITLCVLAVLLIAAFSMIDDIVTWLFKRPPRYHVRHNYNRR